MNSNAPAPAAAAAREKRAGDAALGALMLLFAIITWPVLSAQPLALDDQALLAELAGAPFHRVAAYDHFGHLRPVKNLFFMGLARHPELLWAFRSLSLVAALCAAWCVRALGSSLGLPPLSAAVAAALWLLNPTTLTGVAWLAASNYVFALLGMLAYLLALRAADTPQPGLTARRSWLMWSLAQLALLAATLSHELALLTPAWVLLTRPWQRKQSMRIVLGAALALGVLFGLRVFQTSPALGYRANALPLLQLWAAAPEHVAQNLAQWLIPGASFGVLLEPAPPRSAAVACLTWLAGLAVAALAYRLARRERTAALAVLWCLLFLLPVVDILPLGNTPVATQYAILPAVGLSWLLTLGLLKLTAQRPKPTAQLAVAAGMVLLAWQPAFHDSLRAYLDEQALYETTVRHHPTNVEVRVNLIALHLKAKRWSEARQWLDEALRLAPNDRQLLKNELSLLVQTGRADDALRWLDERNALVNTDPALQLQRALLLLQLGRGREAEPLLRSVLDQRTSLETRVNAGYQLANLWVQDRRFADARAVLQKLHTEVPDDHRVELALRLVTEVLADQPGPSREAPR